MGIISFLRNINSIVLILAITTSPLAAQYSVGCHKKQYEKYTNFESFIDYLYSIDENEAVEVIVDLLIDFKKSIEAVGCETGSLSELAQEAKVALRQAGVDFDENAIDELIKIIEIREGEEVLMNCPFWKPVEEVKVIKHKSKLERKKSKKKDTILSRKTIVGFCKFLAGALCCFVPHPIATSAGVALMINGATDMTTGIMGPIKKHDGPVESEPCPFDQVKFKIGRAIPILQSRMLSKEGSPLLRI